jgi:hypothetical protein
VENFRTPIALIPDKSKSYNYDGSHFAQLTVKDYQDYHAPADSTGPSTGISLLLVHGGAMQKLPTFCLSERSLPPNPRKMQRMCVRIFRIIFI